MIFIILALILYSIALMLGTIASRNADTNLVAAIVNTVSSIIPIAVVIPILNKNMFTNSKVGIVAAVLGGITIALFTMALNKSFTVNKLAIVTPIVFGGSIFLTSILSYIFFKEKISVLQGVGLGLLGVGLILIIYARLSGN